MLSSGMKQFFFGRCAGVRLSQVSFSMPESADGKNFSGSKVVCFTNVEND